MQKVVDYLKFDIEYSEWEVLETIYDQDVLHRVKQIGFEVHTIEIFHLPVGSPTNLQVSAPVSVEGQKKEATSKVWMPCGQICEFVKNILFYLKCLLH